MKNTFLSSILAGMLVALGCGINILAPNPLVGALLFSTALLSICYLELDLYTGKVGFMLTEKRPDFKKLGVILIGNLLGAAVIGVVMASTRYSTIPQVAQSMIAKKLTVNGFYAVFGNSVFCGILMYLAVALYKKGQPLGILMCVPAFILSGFEHSIAYVGYAAMASNIALASFGYLLIAIIGNSLGAFIPAGIKTIIEQRS